MLIHVVMGILSPLQLSYIEKVSPLPSLVKQHEYALAAPPDSTYMADPQALVIFELTSFVTVYHS